MAMNGQVIMLAFNTATEGSPDWTVLPCQTAGGYDLSVDTLDTSCKDSGDGTNLPGRRTRTASVEYRPNDWPEFTQSPSTVEAILRHAAETGVQVEGAIVVSGDEVESFVATITQWSLSAPDQDSVTVSIDLAISGAMTPISS